MDSASPYQALAASCTSRGKVTRPASWQRVCATVPLPTLLSGLTLPHSTGDRGVASWISSLAGSPVPTSPTPASGPASKASTPDFGPSTRASFARYDPASSSWRTSQPSLFEDSTPSSVTWPRSGSMRNGAVSARPRSALRTVESGCSSWPTPTREDSRGSGATGYTDTPNHHEGVTLTDAAVRGIRWATPRAAADKMGLPRAAAPDDLQAQALLWATPQTRDHKGTVNDWASRTRNGKARPVSDMSLSDQAEHWPTPNAEGGTGYMSGSNRDTWRPTLEGMALGYRPTLHQSKPSEPSHPDPATCPHGERCRLTLNPRFVDALLGWPPGWTAFEPLAMGSWLCRQRSRLSSLVGGWEWNGE